MTALAWLIPAALLLGLVGLGAFLWALRSGQFEDLEGAAYRILDDEEGADASNRPVSPAASKPAEVAQTDDSGADAAKHRD